MDPWPERYRRLVLDAAEQRAVLRGVEEIARGLGLYPASAPGRSGGTPRFIADLGALFETRLRRMAARGRREDAIALLREVLDDKRAEAIAAAVIPEETGHAGTAGTGGDAGRGRDRRVTPGGATNPEATTKRRAGCSDRGWTVRLNPGDGAITPRGRFPVDRAAGIPSQADRPVL